MLILTVWVITSALADWVAVFDILPTAPSRGVGSTIKNKKHNLNIFFKNITGKNKNEIALHRHKQAPCPTRAAVCCLYSHLFCEDEYLEQDLPSQAQYGSLARQQSAQTSPYTSQRWRARWVTPKTDPTYSCCCWQKQNKKNHQIK